jgi:O-antigen ligase
MAPVLYKLLAAAVLLVFAFLLLWLRGNKNVQFIEYVMFSFPFIAITLMPSIGYPTIFDLIILTFILFFYRPRTQTGGSLRNYSYLLIIFFISLLFGGIGAESISYNSVPDLVQLICVFAFVKIVFDEIVLNPHFFDRIVQLLNMTILLSILFLFFQLIFGPQFSFEKTANVNVLQGNNIRFPSFFQDPQKYAQFLSAGFFVSLIQTKDRNTAKWWFYVLPIAIIAAVLLSGGRAGLLGLILGVSLIILLGNSRYRIAIVIAAIAIAMISAQYASEMAIFNRESTISDAYEFRFEIWKDAFEIFKAHPLFGIGIGNYAAYVSVHNPDQYWVASNVYTAYDHPESGYLKLLTEYGLIGFLTFFFLILIPIVKGFKHYLNTKDSTSLLLISSLLSWLVGFTTVYSLSDSRIAVYIAMITTLLIIRYKLNLVNELA